METGDYETNVLLINNVLSIAYRLYEPSIDSVQSFPAVAIELESSLRHEGHLVFYDSIRKGIWYFKVDVKDDSLEDAGEATGSVSPESTIQILGYTLSVVEEGVYEPGHFQRGRTLGPHSTKHLQNASTTIAALDSNRPPLPHLQQTAQQVPDTEATTARKIVYENFVIAILLAVTTAFCPATGAIPLNYRTVLLPSASLSGKGEKAATYDHGVLIGTFATHLTTAGSLMVSVNVSQCQGLLSLDNFFAASLTSPGQHVLAAPFGVQTSKVTSVMGELGTASLAQTPNTQILSMRGCSDLNDGIWRQACLKILQLRGVPSWILENCSWVTVSIARRKLQEAKADGSRPKDTAPAGSTVISWPGPLCFRQRAVEVSSTNRLADNILSAREEHRDPLDRAGRWLDSSTERDEQISKRRADRAAQASAEAQGSALRLPTADGLPPQVAGRPSTVLTGAMYPTPPDGIQQQNGVTPMFDAIVSSPRNQPSAPPTTAAVEIEEALHNDTDMNHAVEEVELTEAKRARSDSNLLGDAENMLMGGGDMFGDDDDHITEADFNFFDEQPGPSDMPMADAPENREDVAQKQISLTDEDNAQTTTPHPEPLNPVQLPQESGVFMKPELKDARSFQLDPRVVRAVAEKSAAKVHEPSLFNELTVFRQLRSALAPQSSLANLEPEARKRKANVFERLDFGPVVPLINKKYEKGGLFDFEPVPKQEHRKLLHPTSLPETEYLKRHGRRNRKPKELHLPSRALMARFTALGVPTSHPSPMRRPGSPSDDDQSSAESDQDDTSYTSEDPGSPFKSSMMRLTVDDEAASNVTSFRELESSDDANQRLALELPRLSKPDLPEMSLPKLFKDAEPLNIELSLSDDDMIQIAQLVVEQAATGSLVLADTQRSDNGAELGQHNQHDQSQLTVTIRQCLNVLRDVVSPLVGRTTPAILKSLTAVQEGTPTGQVGSMQPRPVPGREVTPEQLRPNPLYHMPFHHVEVRRADTKLSMLPSAITFWESLGLGPVSGSKNVQGLCAFPAWSGMMDHVKTFFERMKSIYELLKLGTFDPLPLPGTLEDGLLPYEVDKISTSPDASVTKQGSTLIESLDVLHAAIEDLVATDTNIVVFMVYTPTNPGTIVESCLAFQRFFEEHRKNLQPKRELSHNELVLQLISADLISSPSSLVVTPASDLFKLCMEMYDRCTLFDGPMPAPGIILEPSLPRLIDFKLSSSPSASLMHENSCIYVAYAQSLDDRWITAAWTDEGGMQQATAAYCLGRKGRPLSTSMNDVAHEIWLTTLGLTSHRKVHWRINISKLGPMDTSEVDFWSGLAKTENKANVTLILMTVDTSPSVQLLPPVPHMPLSNANTYATPVSTPQGNVVSPEASATPMTPLREANQGVVQTPGADGSGEVEGASTLIDVTDQTWAAVLGYRLNNSTTLLELQPTLMSGYLIKKTGARLQDPLVVMEVNLIHTENTGRAYEPLFREILHNFKGLGTLARARGVVDRETDLRPWHVAAAEKAVRALYMLM